jgi:hypothetical protein
MILEASLNGPVRKTAAILLALGLAAVLTVLVFFDFVSNTLADDRAVVDTETLRAAVAYFPAAGSLHARLAQAEITSADGDLNRAALHARRAVELAPHNYKVRLLLASALESTGLRDAAESSLRDAVRLAPHFTDPHWQLGNLLMRERRIAESIPEFREATRSDPALLPLTFELLWHASGRDSALMGSLVEDRPADQLRLARFFLKQRRPAEATDIMDRLDVTQSLAPAEAGGFVDELIGAGHLDLGRSIWLRLVGANPETLIFNGGFELDQGRFAQFDWKIGGNNYANVTVDSTTSRTGTRSLRIDFKGKDTTRLDNEISQLIPLAPGGAYRLECFARTSGLVTPEGPRLVVSEHKSGKWLASSPPLASGNADWSLVHIGLLVPDSTGKSAAFTVSIKRKPAFSYDDPTSGTVWFDDFTIVRR